MAECQACGQHFDNGTNFHWLQHEDTLGHESPYQCGPVLDEIFVFGSNLAGRHGRGSAYEAKKNWGAKYGVGVGLAGFSYAIPTKDERLQVLSLGQIRKYVNEFIKFAKERPLLIFNVVKIGCGLAGFKEGDMAPLFQKAPANVNLPKGWRE
jgi:hypothetical protein